MGEAKINKDLMRVLNRLPDQEEIEVLIYPTQINEDFKRFLADKKNQDLLNYNILQIANCIVVKAHKKIIREIAARKDVSKVTVNPRFTAQV